jgi:hypothetical protein
MLEVSYYKRCIPPTCFVHSYGHPQKVYHEYTGWIYFTEDDQKSSRNVLEEYCVYNIRYCLQDTFLHLCAFVGFVTVSNCPMHGLVLFKT